MRYLLIFISILMFSGRATAQQLPVYLDDTQSPQMRIEDALSRLSIEEKIAMLHAQGLFCSAGVARLGIPEIWMSDGPHGVRAELNWNDFDYAKWKNDYCTAFPALTCLAATFNPELAMKYGVAIGQEARYRKKDIILGPGVNIYRTPLNGRNFEYMGEDPYLASKLAVPYIRGVQSNGVAACVKHYALNNQEKWRHSIDVELSERALREIYLPAFKAAVHEGGAWSIMGSYNFIRGQHGCHNDYLLNTILKEEWQFDGVVVSDWGGVHDTRQAALNGLDIEMGTGTDGLKTWGTNSKFDNYYMALPLLDLVKRGEVCETIIDDKVRRILRLSLRTTMNKSRLLGSLESEEHTVVAREIAEQGIVLLKNEKKYFPISKGRYTKILVVGENATKSLTLGGGSSELKVRNEISPLEGLKMIYGEQSIVYTMGYGSGPSVYAKEMESPYNADSLKQEALKLAKDADVILFFGGLNKNHYQDCEAADRLSYNLPFGQDELISELASINPNIGVVLISGNAVAMPWLNKVSALMQSWYLGSEAGVATANVISGKVNPSGRLPFTFPVKLSDNGAHYFGSSSYPGTNMKQHYAEDILVGYRWHDTKKIKPLFAFGYGLSYTEFAYDRITTDKREYKRGEDIEVSFTLTNTGRITGAETAQVYITEVKPALMRPAKELKAFKKVLLDAGESQRITLKIPVADLAYYDESLRNWVVAPGKFKIHLAASAADIKSTADIEIIKL